MAPRRDSFRERVLRHKQELLLLGAATGAAVLTNCGYTVVDPMPTPIHCPTAIPSVTAFGTSDGLLVVDFGLTQRSGLVEVLAGPTSPTGATFEALEASSLSVTPDPGSTEVTFTVAINCVAGDTLKRHFRVRLTARTADGGMVDSDGGPPDGGEVDGGQSNDIPDWVAEVNEEP
jgi:hypothetical protein